MFSKDRQAVAVFNLYGVERESEPTTAAEVISEYHGLTVIIK